MNKNIKTTREGINVRIGKNDNFKEVLNNVKNFVKGRKRVQGKNVLLKLNKLKEDIKDEPIYFLKTLLSKDNFYSFFMHTNSLTFKTKISRYTLTDKDNKVIMEIKIPEDTPFYWEIKFYDENSNLFYEAIEKILHMVKNPDYNIWHDIVLKTNKNEFYLRKLIKDNEREIVIRRSFIEFKKCGEETKKFIKSEITKVAQNFLTNKKIKNILNELENINYISVSHPIVASNNFDIGLGDLKIVYGGSSKNIKIINNIINNQNIETEKINDIIRNSTRPIERIEINLYKIYNEKPIPFTEISKLSIENPDIQFFINYIIDTWTKSSFCIKNNCIGIELHYLKDLFLLSKNVNNFDKIKNIFNDVLFVNNINNFSTYIKQENKTKLLTDELHLVLLQNTNDFYFLDDDKIIRNGRWIFDLKNKNNLTILIKNVPLNSKVRLEKIKKVFPEILNVFKKSSIKLVVKFDIC